MNIRGKLHEIYDTKQVSEKFRKRDFIVEYFDNPSFPQYIKFELHQDNTGIIDLFKVGDMVDVTYDLRGKPWTNKEGVKTYFNSLVAWKLQKAESNGAGADESFEPGPGNEDDLPF